MPHTEEYIDFDPEKRARLLCLRRELGERHCPGQFTSVDDLKAKVTTALSLHLLEATRRELDRANRKLARVRGKAEEGRVAVGLLQRLLARSRLEDGLQAGQVPRLGTAQAEQIRVLEQAVAASLPDSKATDVERAGALVLRGNAAYGERRHEEAIEAYQQAIALQPDLAWAHSNLGAVLAEVKRYVEAEVAYRKALELDPGNATAHSNLGLLLAEQKRAAEAEAAYRKALELEPGLAMAHNNLGSLLAGQKRAAEAEAAYRKALELDPPYATALNNLGNLLREQKRTAEAEAAYRNALELDPGYAAAYGNLGWLFYVQGDYARCLELTQQGLAIDPTRAWMQFNLALALLCSRRLEEARAGFEKGIGVSTELAHFDAAVQDLLDLCAQKPDLPGVQEMLERVQMARDEFVRRHGKAAQG
jgi:tetratricopeptide (TPR) repeat protein